MIRLHEAYQDFENLPPLGPIEKMSPFAKFYYTPVELPAPEVLEAIDMDRQMDPAKALAITDMRSLFAPGYQEVENGWCRMPDGTGFSTVKIDMPNVTPEEYLMFQIYTHIDTINYKTWMPKLHLEQGAFTIENFGWGPLLFLQMGALMGTEKRSSPADMLSLTLEDLGRAAIRMNALNIDDPKALDPDYVAFVGGSVYTIDIYTGQRNDMTVVAYIRRKGQGLELRYKVWFGLALVDGRPVRKIPEGAAVPLDKICAIASHNAFEYTRLNTIARDVCAMIRPMMEKMKVK